MEKTKARNFVEQTQAEVTALEDNLALNEADIGQLEAKLREARTRQSGLLNRIESAGQRSKMREMIKGARTEDALARFEVMERRADMAESSADALALGGPERTLADEFADLSADDEVSAELAALKARLWSQEG
jgi:phage shock protein A